jgi:predicted ribosomally synthesized peptide with nif11-like leader
MRKLAWFTAAKLRGNEMSKEEVRKFMEKMSTDIDFRAKILQKSSDAWIASAREEGFDFTAEEYAKYTVGTRVFRDVDK